MAIHYPESNLKILDYNRVLKTLNDIPKEEFLGKISESYDIISLLSEHVNGPQGEHQIDPKPT